MIANDRSNLEAMFTGWVLLNTNIQPVVCSALQSKYLGTT